MRKLPEIGKFYDCYDDGKIHESRKYKVKIISIIPFEKASLYLRAQWRKAQNSYYWIFARETDYFIIGNSYEREDEGIISESIFVRTINGEWYSIGNYWDNGLLIVE